MTINEVEQAIRTLVISQPMITASPIGSSITNLLSVIDNFRNFKLSVQTYPMQDSFKFLTLNECQRLENTLTLSICQVLQEKGLNLMSFLPASGVFSTVQPVQTHIQPIQNLSGVIGQMAFSQPLTQPRPMGQFQPEFQPQINGRQNVQFNNRPYGVMGAITNQQQMPPQQSMQGPQPMYPRQNQSKFGNTQPIFNQPMNEQPKTHGNINGNPRGPQMFTAQYNTPQPAPITSQPMTNTPLKPKTTKLNEVEMVSPTPQQVNTSKPKSTSTMQVQINEPDPVETPTPELLGEDAPPKKAAGRDYLLQLLKK